MSFYVGQKVVCVDDSQHIENKPPVTRYIRCGNIYVVRAVGECPYKPWRYRGPAVWLVGVHRDDDPMWPDFPFDVDRFRPVDERKTDISIFTKILQDARKPVTVD